MLIVSPTMQLSGRLENTKKYLAYSYRDTSAHMSDLKQDLRTGYKGFLKDNRTIMSQFHFT